MASKGEGTTLNTWLPLTATVLASSDQDSPCCLALSATWSNLRRARLSRLAVLSMAASVDSRSSAWTSSSSPICSDKWFWRLMECDKRFSRSSWSDVLADLKWRGQLEQARWRRRIQEPQQTHALSLPLKSKRACLTTKLGVGERGRRSTNGKTSCKS